MIIKIKTSIIRASIGILLIGIFVIICELTYTQELSPYILIFYIFLTLVMAIFFIFILPFHYYKFNESGIEIYGPGIKLTKYARKFDWDDINRVYIPFDKIMALLVCIEGSKNNQKCWASISDSNTNFKEGVVYIVDHVKHGSINDSVIILAEKYRKELKVK